MIRTPRANLLLPIAAAAGDAAVVEVDQRLHVIAESHSPSLHLRFRGAVAVGGDDAPRRFLSLLPLLPGLKIVRIRALGGGLCAGF